MKKMRQINIKLSEEAYDELEQLRKDLNMPSISELVRASVGLQKFLELEKKNGNDLILKHKDTKEQKTVVFRPR